MRIVLLGATGKLGQRLITAALRDDHVVTAFVRDAARLKDQIGPHVPANVEIIEGEIDDEVRLAAAIRDQDVLINAAGTDAPGLAGAALFDQIATMAEEQMPHGARAWFIGHTSVLRIPGQRRLSAELPGLEQDYQTHLMNFRRLVPCELTWSLLCPGPMVPSADGTARKGLRLTKNVLPIALPGHTKWLPARFAAQAYARLLPQMRVTYEDAARVILNHLSLESPYCRMRVGIEP